MGKNTLHRGRHYTCRHLKIKKDKNIKKNLKKVLTKNMVCGIIRMYRETSENNKYF